MRWDFNDRRRPHAVNSTLIAGSSVNLHGLVGGELPGEFGRSRPGLLVGEKTKALPGSVDAGLGAVNVVANNGQAAGYAAEANGLHQAVTWTC